MTAAQRLQTLYKLDTSWSSRWPGRAGAPGRDWQGRTGESTCDVQFDTTNQYRELVLCECDKVAYEPARRGSQWLATNGGVNTSRKHVKAHGRPVEALLWWETRGCLWLWKLRRSPIGFIPAEGHCVEVIGQSAFFVCSGFD